MFNLVFKLSRKKGFNWLLRLLYGCDIPRRTRIDPSVCINHGGLGVVIHPNSVIEGGVHIEHHVTLGQRYGGIPKAPHIEKDCVIGCYAILLGDITIGEGSVIGAGSIVLDDVPPHTIFYNNISNTIKNNSKSPRMY